MRAAVAAVGLLSSPGLLAMGASAHAESPPPPRAVEQEPAPPEGLTLGELRIQPPDRITGIAQLGIGWLTLPSALVCAERNVCRRGDTTPYIELWNLVRLDRGLAFGAGITLGLVPTTDAPREDPPGINRTHRRGYMTIETVARYYPWRTSNVEGWLGAGGGLVIVSDTFTADNPDDVLDRYAFVGSPGVTLRTEGLSLLANIGVSVVLSEYWTLGFVGRAGFWRLPQEPARSPLGDEASLSGTNSVIYAGISLSFQQIL